MLFFFWSLKYHINDTHGKVTNLYNGSSSVQLTRGKGNFAPVSSVQYFPCNFQYSFYSLQCFCVTTVSSEIISTVKLVNVATAIIANFFSEMAKSLSNQA
jgi:hypothetical protein